jgi:hypothetical protein
VGPGLLIFFYRWVCECNSGQKPLTTKDAKFLREGLEENRLMASALLHVKSLRPLVKTRAVRDDTVGKWSFDLTFDWRSSTYADRGFGGRLPTLLPFFYK